MQINNNPDNHIGFKKLHIRNKNNWDAENLNKFMRNNKIKTYANQLDKKGVDLIVEPYNYVDSGNKPKNFGVLLFLRLKNGVKSKSGLNEILTNAYHCAIGTLLDGFDTNKALHKAEKDLKFLING